MTMTLGSYMFPRLLFETSSGGLWLVACGFWPEHCSLLFVWCRSVSAPRTLGDVESTGMARLVGLTRAKGPRGALNPIKQQALTVRSNINHNTREEGGRWDSGGGGGSGPVGQGGGVGAESGPWGQGGGVAAEVKAVGRKADRVTSG